ncbi:high mobility group B protein 14 isoform X1 [Rhododendron vialii]|uniref:high mobility group B protein 14 isoform X1 n=1 Tax=Rhododendron vialii TaxID=182163 RepID=UPI00265D874D|nr:high mobility group B protein 14 isoform X1 [Rhododendron vialii]
MAKKASKSRRKPASASAKNPANGKLSGEYFFRKLVVKMKPTEKTKKQRRPTSANDKPKTTPKKKAAKVDAKKPKKPPTAFFYFLEDFRKEFQEQNPDVKSMRDIGKACGEKWKTMTYEEKVQYYDIATEKRAEFDRATTEYNRRKESGEGHQSEDSEFDD